MTISVFIRDLLSVLLHIEMIGFCAVPRYSPSFTSFLQCPSRLVLGQYVGASGEVVSHVNISHVSPADGGLYQCTAANAAEDAARLNVYGELGEEGEEEVRGCRQCRMIA